MRHFITLVESISLEPFVALAKKYQTYDEFIRATDGMDVLYRGHGDDEVGDHAFMTDYVGHAANYGDGTVDGFAVELTRDNILKFDDWPFDQMRFAYNRLDDEELAQLYRTALAGNRHAGQFENSLSVVREVLESDTPYSEISGNPEINDALVPLMQQYAYEKGKNIIAFMGSDYADYGGHIEYVVRDVSQLVNLRSLYNEVHSSQG